MATPDNRLAQSQDNSDTLMLDQSYFIERGPVEVTFSTPRNFSSSVAKNLGERLINQHFCCAESNENAWLITMPGEIGLEEAWYWLYFFSHSSGQSWIEEWFSRRDRVPSHQSERTKLWGQWGKILNGLGWLPTSEKILWRFLAACMRASIGLTETAKTLLTHLDVALVLDCEPFWWVDTSDKGKEDERLFEEETAAEIALQNTSMYAQNKSEPGNKLRNMLRLLRCHSIDNSQIRRLLPNEIYGTDCQLGLSPVESRVFADLLCRSPNDATTGYGLRGLLRARDKFALARSWKREGITFLVNSLPPANRLRPSSMGEWLEFLSVVSSPKLFSFYLELAAYSATGAAWWFGQRAEHKLLETEESISVILSHVTGKFPVSEKALELIHEHVLLGRAERVKTELSRLTTGRRKKITPLLCLDELVLQQKMAPILESRQVNRMVWFPSTLLTGWQSQTGATLSPNEVATILRDLDNRAIGLRDSFAEPPNQDELPFTVETGTHLGREGLRHWLEANNTNVFSQHAIEEAWWPLHLFAQYPCVESFTHVEQQIGESSDAAETMVQKIILGLVQSVDPHAFTWMLDAFSSDEVFHYSANLKRAVQSTFASHQKAHSWPIEAAMLSQIPWYMFDKNATRTIGKPNPLLSIRIDEVRSYSLFSEDGYRLAGITRNTAKRVNPEVLNEARDVTKKLDKLFEAITKALRVTMKVNTQWPYDLWEYLFCRHPILKHYGASEIWVQEDGTNAVNTFRCNDGELCDVEDRAYTLKPNTPVRIFSPTCDQGVPREKWAAQLTDYKVLQPIEQV